MNWILYLIIATTSPTKTDVSRKWVMTSQATCQAAVDKSKISHYGPTVNIEINGKTTTVESSVSAHIVLVCVQELKK